MNPFDHERNTLVQIEGDTSGDELRKCGMYWLTYVPWVLFGGILVIVGLALLIAGGM